MSKISFKQFLGAYLSLGAVCSILIIGVAAEYVGKKMCLIILSFPALLFWIFTYISTDVFHLYTARTVAGKYLESKKS